LNLWRGFEFEPSPDGKYDTFDDHLQTNVCNGDPELYTYLDCPHSDRGGVWYACRYHAGARTTRRRSLKTRDVEEAKIKLAALVAAAPQATSTQATPGAGEVLTLAVFKAYTDGRGSMIASEEAAARAVQLFTDHLETTRSLAAPVAFWTPARQLEFARWGRSEHGHSAPYIARLFNVMRSAFIDATQVKMRFDAVGNLVEAALITSAPRIVMTCDRIAKELNIAVRHASHCRRSIRWQSCSTHWRLNICSDLPSWPYARGRARRPSSISTRPLR
jgi:hypothetical protein